MGRYANHRAITTVAAVAAVAVIACNAWLVIGVLGTDAAASVFAVAVACVMAFALLGYLAFAPLRVDALREGWRSPFNGGSNSTGYNAAHPTGR
jgi:hypothetical protein